jgi:V/A-type H+-transporting ATPase subunit I
MTKIEIVGHRSRLDATLASVQRHGWVQLVDATAVPGLMLAQLGVDEAYLREGEKLRLMRTRLDAFLSLAPSPAMPSGAAFTVADLEVVEQELEELVPTVEPLVARIDALKAEQGTVPRHVASLRRLLPLVPEIPELETYETVALLVERRHAAVVGMLQDELAGLLDTHFEVISGQVDPNTIGAVLVFPRRESRRVHGLLAQAQVSRVHLPDQFRGLPLGAAIGAMERRLSELPAEVESAGAELMRLLASGHRWHDARDHIARRLAQLEALRNIGTTERVFAIVGWTPRRRLDGLAEALRADVGTEVVVVETGVAADETPPILLSNPRAARPFELFVRMLALPRYGTFDPTVLMAIFMPFFFGVMLGDVAYGLILLAVAVWARRRWGGRSDVAADLTRVLAIGAAWAVAWGVVFGEVFGDLGRRLVDLQPLWINREEAIKPLLLFAVGIGAAHVVLGLVLGLSVSARSGDRRKLGERAALLAALCALFAVAGVATDLLPAGLMTPLVAVVVTALVVLIGLQWPLGLVMGPLGLVGAITNVLSYLRIAAIGLASVFLARVANELGTTVPLALGLVIAALFHAMNLALGAFSPTIQALRLHYVEFFDKFYEPGGKPFQPFGGAATPVPALPVPARVPVEVDTEEEIWR